MHQYKLKPASFPNEVKQKEVQYLTEEHKALLLDCYNRYATNHHGMLYKTENELNPLFKNPNNIIVGFIKKQRVEGYAIFTFKKESETNFTYNDILVKEFVYENSEAMHQLFSFFHSQFDQINRIVMNTQDDHFYFHFL